MLPKIKQFFISHEDSFLLRNKITVGIVCVIVLLLLGSLAIVHGIQKKQVSQAPLNEVDLSFDAEGPYALLAPRRDGNALILNLIRTSSYDSISYELAYVAKPDDAGIPAKTPAGKAAVVDSGDGGDGGGDASQGVDRGVVGTIDTKDKKGEYQQEILFGTCSKNVCKYDQGVENGTLTLHIVKGSNAYRMNTQWHLQRPDTALGILTSGDGHFVYKLSGAKDQLTLIGYTIINDLTGLPKLPDGKMAFGKSYALNVPDAKDIGKGDVSFEEAETVPAEAKIAKYDETKNAWTQFDTKLASGSGKLTAQADGAGIFAVLINKK